jgi:hypothetical protein
MKHRLEFEFDYSFLLFGISCRVPSYTLCWHINKKLGLNMGLIGEHEVIRKKLSSHHLLYQEVAETEEGQNVWSLVANQGTQGALLPEYKTLDYFLTIEAEPEPDATEIRDALREIRPVLACYTIEPEEIKSRENLIFDI